MEWLKENYRAVLVASVGCTGVYLAFFRTQNKSIVAKNVNDSFNKKNDITISINIPVVVSSPDEEEKAMIDDLKKSVKSAIMQVLREKFGDNNQSVFVYDDKAFPKNLSSTSNGDFSTSDGGSSISDGGSSINNGEIGQGEGEGGPSVSYGAVIQGEADGESSRRSS